MSDSLHRSPVLVPQLVTEIGARPGAGLLLSVARELERGARAALFLAPSLFRFDCIFEGDTMRTHVRNLSTGVLRVDTRHHNTPGTNLVFGDAGPFEPALSSIAFELGFGTDLLAAEVTLGTVLRPAHGTVRVLAQAVLSQVAAPA